MYSVQKLKLTSIRGLLKTSNILYKCGKDMAARYDLHHWDNSHVKNWCIVALCALKNDVYLVYDGDTAIATFQTHTAEDSLLFQKLATLPEFSGKGVGSFCLEEIERLGREKGLKRIICEVYDKSGHAMRFYEHKGYEVYGETDTR